MELLQAGFMEVLALITTIIIGAVAHKGNRLISEKITTEQFGRNEGIVESILHNAVTHVEAMAVNGLKKYGERTQSEIKLSNAIAFAEITAENMGVELVTADPRLSDALSRKAHELYPPAVFELKISDSID